MIYIVTDFEFGQIVKDIISGYEGVVTAIKQEYGGQPLYLVIPQKLLENGDIPDGYWFPKERLEVMDSIKLKEETISKRGENEIC